MSGYGVCVDVSQTPPRYGVVDLGALVVMQWCATRDEAVACRRDLEILRTPPAESRVRFLQPGMVRRVR